MEPTNKRYSFADAAAEQPTRERFSFSKYSTRSGTEPVLNASSEYRSFLGLTPTPRTPKKLEFTTGAASPSTPLVTPSFTTQTSTVDVDTDAKGFDAINFGKEVIQGTAREYMGLAKAIEKGSFEAEVNPDQRITQILTGRETPFSFADEARDFGDAFGISEKVATPLLVGLTALDFVTIPGKRKLVTDALKGAKTVEDGIKVLRNAGLPDEVINGLSLGERAVKVTSTEQADELLLEAVQSIQKGGPSVLDAVRAQGIWHTVPSGSKFDGRPVFSVDVDRLVGKPIVGSEYAGKLDEAQVKRYMDEYSGGGRPEPIRLELSKDGALLIEDGMHKVEALRRLGIDTVEAIDVTRRTADFEATRKGLQDLIADTLAKTGKQAPLPKTSATGQAAKALPKVERRFVEQFPELGSTNHLTDIRSRTRGTISNEKSLAAARELGYTEDTLLRMPEGKALNAEQKMAVSGVVENARLRLQSLTEKLSAGAQTMKKSEIEDLRNQIVQQRLRYYQLYAVERGVAAEAGRTLQAHKAAVTAIEQQERWLAKKLADPDTPQDLKDYIYKRLSEFTGEPNELPKLLRELSEASLTEKFVEWWTMAKLWATQTHIVNAVSSTARMLMRAPEHAVSSLINKLDAKVTGTARERFVSDATAELSGQIMGFKSSGREALNAFLDEGYAFEARKLQDYRPKGPAIKGRPGKNELSDKLQNWIGKAVRIPGRFLGAEDMMIRKPSEMGALYTAVNRRARMEGLKPGTKEWDEWVGAAIEDPIGTFDVQFMREIQEIADENLFQESLHPALRKLQEVREAAPSTKFIVPFYRTIVNLAKQGMQFSPVSVALPSTRKALKAGGGARADAISRMMIGSTVMTPLIYHALEGKITTSAPTNPADRDKFYAEGKQPYSIRVGDKWYPYHRFSPWSDWFVTAGAMADAINAGDDASLGEKTTYLFLTLTRNLLDKSFAIGLKDLFDAIDNPSTNSDGEISISKTTTRWMQNFITGGVMPNFIPLVARTVDPVIRETATLEDAFKAKMPWLSKDLAPKTDVFGKPLTRPGSAVERFISPVIPSPVAVDSVRAELEDVGYKIGFPGKTAAGYEMDDEAYRIYQAASGKVIYQALFVMMQSPQYQNLTARQKEKAIDRVVRDTRDAVKNQVAQEQIIMGEIKNELKNQGYSSSKAEDMAVEVYEILKTKQAEQSTQGLQ